MKILNKIKKASKKEIIEFVADVGFALFGFTVLLFVWFITPQ
jgi:hypothetical protein